MTEIAIRLEAVDPVFLRQHGLAEPVAVGSGAGKLARRRRRQQRQPVVAGIHLRRFLRRLRHIRAKHDRVALRLHLDRCRIDQPVAADPDAVGRVGKLRQGEAAAIVGDDNLDEPCRQIARFGDDPHAGLGTLAALHDAGDVIGDAWRPRCTRRCAARLECRDVGGKDRGRDEAHGHGAAGANHPPCGQLHAHLLITVQNGVGS